MTKTHSSQLALVAVLLLASAGPARGEVQIVGPSPQSFPGVQEAVDAAVDGDVLLISPGDYAGFVVDGKSLLVLPLHEGSVQITSGVRIRNLSFGRTVVLSGLEITGVQVSGTSEAGLEVTDTLGQVRIQDCTLTGGPGLSSSACTPWGHGGPGAKLVNNLRVAFSATTCNGGGGYGDPNSSNFTCEGGDGGAGVFLQGTAAAFYDCELNGGQGGPGQIVGGGGGDGCHVADFGVFSSGCQVVGGDGGFGWDALGYGGDGGGGMYVDPIAQAQLLDNTFVRGNGGGGIGGPGGAGQALAGGGIIKQHSGAARVFDTGAIVAEGRPEKVTVTGQAGDRAFLLPSFTPGWSVPNPKNGIWLVPVPTMLSWPPAVVFSAPGQAKFKWQAPNLAQGSVRQLFLQGLMLQGPGSSTLGSPAHVLVLNSDGSPDCDGNGLIDYLDLLEGTHPDCDGNLVPDVCDVAGGQDCNGNSIPDACDIATGASTDCDANGTPDECQVLIDCNANSVLDACDILNGTSLDQNGNGIPDECEGNLTWYVDPAAGPGGDGSLAMPFDRIQAAIDVAVNGDDVILLDGLYTGPGNRAITFGGRDIAVRSQNGPAACVVDLEDLYQGFTFDSGETAAASLEGVTITRGLGANGGGIYVAFSSPGITNCVVTACRAQGAFDSRGGGIYLLSSDSVVSNCVVTDCHAEDYGGGMAVLGGGYRVEGCQVLRNTCGNGGAGIYAWNSTAGATAVIIDCLLSENVAGVRAGGVFLDGFDGFMVLSHCQISGNSAVAVGGGVVGAFWKTGAGTERCRIDNCLIVGNSALDGGGISMLPTNNSRRLLSIACSTVAHNVATGSGGGLLIPGFSSVDLGNSVLWGNTATAGSQIGITYLTTDLTVEYNDVQGGLPGVSNTGGGMLIWGGGNVDSNPLFAAPLAGDYRLGAGSPAADAGSNPLVPPDLADVDGDGDVTEPVPLDLDFTSRFEDDPVPDTGVGPAPVVDMGAYERP